MITDEALKAWLPKIEQGLRRGCEPNSFVDMLWGGPIADMAPVTSGEVFTHFVRNGIVECVHRYRNGPLCFRLIAPIEEAYDSMMEFVNARKACGMLREKSEFVGIGIELDAFGLAHGLRRKVSETDATFRNRIHEASMRR